MDLAANTSVSEMPLRKSEQVRAKKLRAVDFPSHDLGVSRRPFRRAGKGGRNRKKLDSNEVPDRFVRSGHTSDMADAGIHCNFSSIELQMKGLDRL
jgi:hypothetical protein